MISRVELKTDAREQLSGILLDVVAIFLVGSLLLGAISSIGIGIAFIVFVGVFEVGYVNYLLAITRKKERQFSMMFSGFDNFSRAMITGLLVSVFTFLWSLLLLIPGLVKNYSYSMTYFIMHDNPTLSGKEAITASREMMDGHKKELFVLDLSFIGWFILGALTLGILNIFYITPYHRLTRANFYEQLRLERSRPTQTAQAERN